MSAIPETNDTALHEALAPASMEWNGVLAQSANYSALFALYLALHESRVVSQPQWQAQADPAVDHSNELDSLKVYRRSALSLSADAIANVQVQSQLRSDDQHSSAWLMECLHPTPLHFRNDAKLVDDAIIANCRYATQLNEVNRSNNTAAVNPDATLLADIVPAAQSML